MEVEMEMVLQLQLLCFLGTLVHMDVDSVLSKIVEPAAPNPMNLRTLLRLYWIRDINFYQTLYLDPFKRWSDDVGYRNLTEATSSG